MPNELPEIQELPTRSIAPLDSELLPNEQPPTATFKGVTGLLLRRRVDNELLALTMSEFNECLEANAPADTEL